MIYRHPDAVLIIFCKAPIPGQVKTRLLPALSAEQAADLHAELATKTLQKAVAGRLCPVQLWCSPTTEHAFFTGAAASLPITLHRQQGSDLGERMHRAFCSALENHSHALLIGCDCPSLTAQDLEQALLALKRGRDVVLGPAEDGGYVLIGLNQARPELFDGMSWGTAEVLAQTRRRIAEYRLSRYEIGEQWDVDTPDDLRRYCRERCAS